MNVLKKLGFVKNDEPIKSPETAKPIQQNIPIMTFGPSAAPVAQAGTNYTEYFNQVFEENNLPGLDFREFDKTLQSFEGKPISEPQKYEFAFAGFLASGISVDTLINSSNHYLGLIDKKEMEFNTEVDGVKKEVSDKEKELQGCNQKMKELTERIQTLNEQMFSSQQKLASEEQAFNFHATSMRSIIANKVNKINQYIKNATITGKS